jgi:hypothetical protein
MVTHMKTDLVEVETMLDTMAQSGALEPDSYYKCLASLASEHAVKYLDIERALVLLNKLPPAYLSQVLAQQMADDGLFAEAMVQLTYRMQQLGVIGNVQKCNMTPAEA